MKVIYAGSFDPITYGHLWVIKQASRVFDEVIIAVGINPNKIGKYKYPIEDRMNLIEQLLPPNAKVVYIGTKLLASYAKEIGADFIIKGVRDEKDFKEEKDQRHVNNQIYNALQTILMIPPKELENISSSFVKMFIGYDDWQETLKLYVPSIVADYMYEFESKKVGNDNE